MRKTPAQPGQVIEIQAWPEIFRVPAWKSHIENYAATQMLRMSHECVILNAGEALKSARAILETRKYLKGADLEASNNLRVDVQIMYIGELP